MCLLGIGFAMSFVMAKEEESPPSEKVVPKETVQKEMKEPAAQASEPTKEAKPKTAQEKLRAGICLANEAAIEDIRKLTAENEAKEKELAAKEAELKNRELMITEELKKLSEDREVILKAKQEKERLSQEKVTKLVETFLSMSPKAAAKILSAMDNDLAVAVMYQMDNLRLAKIVGLMEIKRSTELSELLAGIARAKEPTLAALQPMDRSVSRGTAEAKQNEKKGGE
jgi:flagellar motility protein MotE (MotC chaperone)